MYVFKLIESYQRICTIIRTSKKAPRFFYLKEIAKLTDHYASPLHLIEEGLNLKIDAFDRRSLSFFIMTQPQIHIN